MKNAFKRWTLHQLDSTGVRRTFLVRDEVDLNELLSSVMQQESAAWLEDGWVTEDSLTFDELADVKYLLEAGRIADAWDQFQVTNQELHEEDPTRVSLFFLETHTGYATASDYLAQFEDPDQKVLPVSATETLDKVKRQLGQSVEELRAELAAKLEKKGDKSGDCQLTCILNRLGHVGHGVNGITVEDLKPEAVE